MNRQQERLMKKQLLLFEKKFNSFSIYQLSMIRDLIIDIINRKVGAIVNDK